MKLRTAKKLIRMDIRGAYVSTSRIETAWDVYLSRRRPRRRIQLYPAQVDYFSPASAITGWTGGAPSASSVKLDFAALREALSKIGAPLRPMVAVMLPKHMEALKAKCGPVDPQTRMPTLFGGLAGCEIRTKDTAEECRALAIDLQFNGHQVFLFTDVEGVNQPDLPEIPPWFSLPTMRDLSSPMMQEAGPMRPSVWDYLKFSEQKMLTSLGVPAPILNGGECGSYSAYHSQFSKPQPPKESPDAD